MSDILYEILQSKKSGGSGTGVSYHAVAALCGRKARLKEEHPYEEVDEAEVIGATTPTGRRKVNGARAGSFYHALQEMWRVGTIPTGVVIDATEHQDYDYELALRSFRNYRNFFGDNPHNLGRVVDAEVKYPASPEQVEQVRAVLGAVPFTMRYDLKVYIDEAMAEEITKTRQVALPGPGYYLVDYKLVGSIGPKQFWDYTTGMQALSYPIIHNICNPEAPVRGMIYDLCARVAKPEAKHFQLFMALETPDALDIVRNGLALAHANYTSNQPNPFACTNGYGVCPFLTNGICTRK